MEKPNGLEKINIHGLEFVFDKSIPKDLIFAYDPESLYIENGVIKFKKPVMKAKIEHEINE
jgi:hypothetical protein